MGNLIKTTIVNNNTGGSKTPLEYFYTFLNSSNCPLITSQSLSNEIITLGIDNTIQLILDAYSGYEMYIIDDTGTKIAGSNFNTFRGYFHFTIYFTNTFFYLQFKDNYGDKFFLVYEKIGGKRYFGTTWSDSTISWFSITALNFKQVENQSYYKYGSLLNYSCNLDSLDYSSNILFDSNNQITDIIDSNTFTCSTVLANTILTFNGKNYYSIGTNTLVEVDL